MTVSNYFYKCLIFNKNFFLNSTKPTSCIRFLKCIVDCNYKIGLLGCYRFLSTLKTYVLFTTCKHIVSMLKYNTL